ncbi:hypothetical protein FHX42_000886 [Saccharopolyspora lacisalsi]|uniref:Low molecular weight protein antigen 6 PH domain-containing protein n=1 Tax=Halosaccharopolyspora lacisalsi TaxID=1000566 RepID=A0A839DVV1_9PSEU|nr:PH domain-containing protein [Halosaccharopolyspora lacisalsi]MBA8823557.1 hypothetical protein [Halosaccharopolyspora lacisalsi]
MSTRAAESTVTVRPHKVRLVAIPSAVTVVVICVVAAVFLRSTPTGVLFRISDQIAMVGIGVVLAGLILLVTRPRLRADEDGVEIRNAVMTYRYPWSMVLAVSFPDGAAWARVELPEDENTPIMAIQAADGARAVQAMRELRDLRRRIGHLEG